MNRLSQDFGDADGTYLWKNMRHSFLSKFVLQILRAALDVGEARNLFRHCQALENPTMEGWAFEELVRQLFCDASKEKITMRIGDIGCIDRDLKPETWERKGAAIFTFKRDGKGNVVKGLAFVDSAGAPVATISQSTAGWPQEWNFPTLDHVIFRVKNSEVRLDSLQDTISTVHGVNEHVLISFYECVKAMLPRGLKLNQKMRHIAIVKNNPGAFSFDNPVSPRAPPAEPIISYHVCLLPELLL
jgi:hypothetical protein